VRGDRPAGSKPEATTVACSATREAVASARRPSTGARCAAITGRELVRGWLSSCGGAGL